MNCPMWPFEFFSIGVVAVRSDDTGDQLRYDISSARLALRGAQEDQLQIPPPAIRITG